MNKILEQLLYSIYFLALVTFLIYTKHTNMGENWDDYLVWYLLKSGIDMTLIISYPLSKLLSYLYLSYPSYQWFSYMYMAYIILCVILAANIVSHTRSILIKISLLIFYSLCFGYLLLNYSITLLSGLLIVLSTASLFYNYKLFIIGMFFALFLRTELMIVYLPFIVLIIVMLKQHIDTLSFKDKLLTFFTAATYIFIILSPASNTTYKNWLTINSARGYFFDSKTYLPILMAVAQQKISDDERFLLEMYWFQDNKVLPSKTLIDAAGDISDQIFFSKFYPHQLLLTKLHNFYYLIIILFVYLFALLILKHHYRTAFLLTVYTILLFTVFIFRDAERVMLPLILLWFTTVYYIFRFKIGYFSALFGIVIFLMLSLYLNSYILFKNNYKKILFFKEDLTSLLKSKTGHYEISLRFPYLKAHNYIDKIIKQQPIMYESEWMDLHHYNIYLPYGWLTRHPYFYQERNITSDNIHRHRKYQDYHSFLIDPSTYFIGEIKQASKHFQKRFLNIYDKLYNQNNNCHHEIILVDTSKYFSISQIVNKCEIKHNEE